MSRSSSHVVAVCAAAVALLVCCSAARSVHAQSSTASTCAIANTITLATLSPVHTNISFLDPASASVKTYPLAFAVGFCSPIQPTSAGLRATGVSACGADGYVTVSNLTSGQCLASYPFVTTTLAYTSARTAVSSVVATTNGVGVFANTAVNVTLSCNTAYLNTQAVLAENVTYDAATATWRLRFFSGAACNASSFFCSSNADCASSGKTCVKNVCFNANCAQLKSIITPVAKTNSAVLTQMSVVDCTGTPLPNLTASDFDVTLNGQSLRRTPQFNGEVDMYVSSTASAQPALTVLLIDQSASITQNAASLAAVKAAALRFVQLVQGQNPFHYIAIVAFDGSASPVIVVGHTTDTAKLEIGINSMPPAALKDPASTNLYGAVKEAVALAHAMRFSFGAANATVSSTMLVFTDGFDTSSRSTRSAAVTAVQKQVATVRVVGIGVASTSDSVFLQSISTSGIFYFSSDLSTISSAFEQIAQRLTTSSASVYSVGICSPLRASNVTAVFMLNTTAFTTTQTISANFDASAHEGSTCSNKTLASDLFLISLNSSTTNKTETLTMNGGLTVSVETQAALFFSFTCDTAFSPALLTVTPSTVLLYLLNASSATCGRVSPYCWDVAFFDRGVVTCKTGSTYTGMALPPTSSTVATTVSLTAISLAGQTLPPGSINATTIATTVAAGGASASTLFALFNASSYTTEGDAHVDAAAAWIIFAFLLVGIFAILAYNIYWWSQRVKTEEIEADKRQRAARSVIPSQVWGGRGDESPRQQLEVIMAAPQPYNAYSPLRGPGYSPTAAEYQAYQQQGMYGNGGSYPRGGLSRNSAALSPVGHSRSGRGFVPLDPSF